MSEHNKIDQVLTNYSFTENEKKAFLQGLTVIRKSQSDPSIDVEDELKNIIRECVENEISEN